MPKNIKIAVLGAGNMGTAIAQVVAKNGFKVNLWNHESDPEPLRQIAKFGENKKYSPGIKLSKNIAPQADLAKAVADAAVVFFVVPSNFMDALAARVAARLRSDAVCVDVSKGMQEKTLDLITNVIKKRLSPSGKAEVVTISGPAIANDMAKGGFTAMNAASRSAGAISMVKKVMESDSLKLVPSTDVVGVEITGSLKNVYAIAMGVCDGLRMPMNTKAALLVVALKEIGALIKKMGGRSETVYDLAGLGDVVGTGLSYISRNRRYGECLAKGLPVDKAARKVGQTVEGISASKVLHLLSKKHGVKMPFAEAIYKMAWGLVKPDAAIKSFLKNFE